MDRELLVWLVPVLIGAALLATVPPDAQYTVEVYEPSTVDSDLEVTAYENLTAENKSWFREARNGTVRFATGGSRDPPEFGELYVADEGTTYEMTQYVISGNVLAIVQPWAGIIAIMLGAVGAAVQYRYRT